MNALSWQSAAPGILSARVGAEALDLLRATGVASRSEALAGLGNASLPFAPDRVTVESRNDGHVLSIPFAPTEKLYGLGLNFKRLDVQQSVRRLRADHFGGKDDGRTHAPVPFYVSHAGYGVFVNVARYITVYAGGVHRKERHPPVHDRLEKGWKAVYPGHAVEIAVPGPGFEVFLIAGPTPLDVVRRFNLLCGGGCLPPRWGLGFWHRVPIAYTADDVADEVAAFRDKGYPLDVVGLEPGWHSQSYPTSFEWNETRFPDPANFIAALAGDGVRVNLWENGFIAPDAPLAESIEPLTGSHTGGWGGLIPDLTLQEARDAIADQHDREHAAVGVSGYKLDECDGYDRWLWPDHATFPSGHTGEQVRQLFGLQFQRLTTDLFHRRNQRTYGLVRATNAAGVSFPYVLYSDAYSHRDFITALCSAGFCGLLWTPEARRSSSPEEWLRRMQAVCFSPLAMINAWADGTKPWSFPEVADAVRDVMRLRIRFLPYLYSVFARYHRDGTPPFLPMPLVFSADASATSAASLDSESNPYPSGPSVDRSDQFMMGPSLLVAPLFAGEPDRTVLFPPGPWFDFYSGEPVAVGPTEITVSADRETIPLYVRDGGIIPLIPESDRVPRAGEQVAVEVRHYGSASGTFDLYDDDGLTYAFESGAHTWTRLHAAPDENGALSETVDRPEGAPRYAWRELAWRFMS